MKALKPFVFITLIFFGQNVFAQTDSIYALNAKIENGRLKIDFMSTYKMDQLCARISIRDTVTDTSVKIGNLSLTCNNNNDGTLFVQGGKGSYTYSTTNQLTKIILDQPFSEDIAGKKLKLTVYVRYFDSGKFYDSNELVFFFEDVLTALNLSEQLREKDDLITVSYYTLEGKKIQNALEMGCYIVIKQVNGRPVVEKICKMN